MLTDCEGIIEEAIMLGAPVTGSADEWRPLARVVSGRIVNGYSRLHLLLFLAMSYMPGIVAYKHDEMVDVGTQRILDLCNGIMKEGCIPEDWKSSVVLPIYKGKRDPMECGSYRGIKLLEDAIKMVERIFEDRIRRQVDTDDMQFAFMKGKGTSDAIFMHDSIYAIARICHGNSICPSVCRLSICPSVTRVDQSKTVEARITQFSPYPSL